MCDTYKHGYRLRIYPTEEQKELINKYIHLYRFVYNWGVALEEQHYQEKKDGKSKRGFYSFYDLGELFTKFRNTPGNEWIKEIPKDTAKMALRDVYNSYTKFFMHKSRYPKFKSKKRSPKMFKTRYDRFYIDGDKVRFEGLPKIGVGANSIVDKVDLKFNSGFSRKDNIKYIQPSISIDNLGNYWVSFSIDEPKKILKIPKSEPIGIDVGIRQTIVLSTGEIYIRPKKRIKKLEKQLQRIQHHVSRDINRRMQEAKRTKTKYDDIPISKRAQQRANKVRKIYTKITNIKQSFYYNTIKEIVTRNPESIVIETISTRDMQKNNKQNKYMLPLLHTANFYTIHKIIENKCEQYGIQLIKAPSEYPSSQICSNCGYKQNIGKKPIFKCPKCGTVIDRDINAAINLRNLVY